MDYISLITKEEQSRICDIIGGCGFKEYFIRYSKGFESIKPGFRVKKLSEVNALNSAKQTLHTPYIKEFINIWIQNTINTINESAGNFEIKGESHEKAIALALADSCFFDNIDIFIKLECNNISNEQSSVIKNELAKIKDKRNQEKNTENKLLECQEMIENLNKNLQEANDNYAAVLSKNDELHAQIEALSSELSHVKAQKTVSEAVISNNDILTAFEDKKPNLLPVMNSEEIFSLCEVFTDYNGITWLKRYADIDYNGRLSIFYQNEFNAPLFSNRDKLFYKDGPSENGMMGIWNWYTVPNNSDPSKDYVFTTYNIDINPIEIITLPEVSTLDGLIDEIEKGCSLRINTYRIMISAQITKGKFIGILCNKKDLIKKANYYSFSDSIVQVPVYEFTLNDTIKLDNNAIFLNKVYAGVPNTVYRIKQLEEIVKDIVVNSISWTNYKLLGIARSDYRNVKDFISSIPINTVIENISKCCQCNKTIASELYEQFLQKVDEYIDVLSLEDDIIISAVRKNDEIMNRAKTLVKKEWETENLGILNQANEKICVLNSQIASSSCELEKINNLHNSLIKENETLLLQISEKENLAKNVETEVDKRIKQAQNNAAEFIANQAFINHSPSSSATVSTPSTHAKYSIIKRDILSDDIEAHINWSEVICTAEMELKEAGITPKYQRSLATFLCAAYINKQPIILVGPNTYDISKAFSMSVDASKYGVLQCEGDFSLETINKFGCDGEQIIILNNLVQSGWLSRIPEIVQKKDTMFIGTHSFPEDIQVEPVSIYNYVLPLFTEFFVDSSASGVYCGGYFLKDFIQYKAANNHRKEQKFISNLNCNMLIKNKINSVLSVMHDINKSMTADDDFLFGILQYCYATMDMTTLHNTINDSHLSNGLRSDLKYLWGDNDE